MTAAGSAQAGRGNVVAAVAVTLTVQTTISLLAASTPVLAPVIVADRGWDSALMSFYAPIISVTSFIAAFQVPMLLQRLGGMGLGLACIGVSVTGLLGLMLPSLAAAAAAPFAVGLANGAMNAASSQILGPRTSPGNAGFIMSLKQTGVPLGGVLAGALVPFLVLASNWRAALLDVLVGSALLAAALLPTVGWLNGEKPAAPLGKYQPFEPLKRLVSMPGMLPLLVASLVFVAMQHCLRSFFALYLVSERGIDLDKAGLAFSISQLAGIIGQIGWAVLSDRVWSSRVVMAIIGLVVTLAAVLTAAITASWPLIAIFVVAALFGVSAAGFIPVVLAEVARRSPPGEVGALTSGASLFQFAGILLGPLTFGAVLSIAGYRAAFITLAGCSLAVSVLLGLSVTLWRK